MGEIEYGDPGRRAFNCSPRLSKHPRRSATEFDGNIQASHGEDPATMDRLRPQFTPDHRCQFKTPKSRGDQHPYHYAGDDRGGLSRIEDQQLHTNIRIDIAKVLGSLVRVSDSKVYLVHITLKNFFVEDLLSPAFTRNPNAQHLEQNDLDLRRANLFIASAYMAYLSLGCFTEDIYSDENACNERLSLDSFHDGCQLEREEKSRISLQADEEAVDGYTYGHVQQITERVDAGTCERVVQRYRLFEYAATSWAEHFAQGQELADKRLQNLALRL